MTTRELAERKENEPDQRVMPFYIVCDVSQSMYLDMESLNSALRKLMAAIGAEPIIVDFARVSILTFSSAATLVVPLARPDEITSLPHLQVEGGTDYGVAFKALANAIEHDVAALKAAGFAVNRPCAFFLTDGEPVEDATTWHITFKDTLTYDRTTSTGMPNHPIFIPFGFREAREDHLKQLAYPPERGRWFLAKRTSPEDALKSLMSVIMNTILTSSRTAGTPDPRTILATPDNPNIAHGDSAYDANYSLDRL